MPRAECHHVRRRSVPVDAERGTLAEWCRDCGAFRVGVSEHARWVYPGKRGSVMRKSAAERARHAPMIDRQLRLVGADDVACPDCTRGLVLGVTCGFCVGSGRVSREVAEAVRCPACSGQNEACGFCHGVGWVSPTMADQIRFSKGEQ